MSKFVITLFIVLASIQVFGQRVKYEDDLHRILTLSPGGEIAELGLWLAKEPTNPSIFLQMALVYEKRYQQGDPLKDYAYKIGNAKLALVAFERTEQYITEKDVKKNKDAYYNFGIYDSKGKFYVPYDSVISKITRTKVEINEFVKYAPEIYQQFTQSFSNYDQAHKIYARILGEYPTFKDLYLLYNEEVDAEFEQLKSEYLTAVDHFEKYVAASDSFDIGYKQNLIVDEINTYRLDGPESEINFLNQEIQVWNYAKWVDDTRLKINDEIGALRTSLSAENIRIDTKIKDAIPDYVRDNFEPLKVSKEVLFNLRKYDLNSVVEPLFLYKQREHDLIYHKLQSESIDTSATVDVERKLYLYGQLINKVRLADSTLADVTRRNTDLSYEKYTSFIDTHYSGVSGINEFAGRKMKENAGSVQESVDKIRTYIYEKLSPDTVLSQVAYKKFNIPMQVQQPIENEFLTNELITTNLLNTFDGSSVLAGIYKNEKEGKTQAYVCGITAENEVAWYNDYLLIQDSSGGFDSDTRVAVIEFVPGGIAFVLNGSDSTGLNRINHLMIVDETGNITLSRHLLLSQYPRAMNYSSKDNSLIITYKGDEFSETIFKESELIIASYNILGDMLWQKRKGYKGDIVGLVETDEAYILTGNYSEMKDKDGRIQRAGTKNTDSKSFAMSISRSGEINDTKLIDYPTPFFTSINYKVSDDCINLFGSKGDYEKKITLDADDQDAFHLILNSDLEVLSNSLK
ncbi:MAG: hypothetical protein JXR03_00965 [Cyclobacteriaceae bacterium]